MLEAGSKLLFCLDLQPSLPNPEPVFDPARLHPTLQRITRAVKKILGQGPKRATAKEDYLRTLTTP